MLRLKSQRVPLEKNILTLVFNIGSEARLLHTCKFYSSTLPCFQEKVRECGDDKQKRVMSEVSKTIMYLCSPFSLQRQRAVIEHQKCISSVLSLPASTGCDLNDHEDGRSVLACKKECSTRGSDFICMMRTWISEQNTCTLRDIQQKCGDSASNLFQEFQRTVFEPNYPIVCNSGNETLKIPEKKQELVKERKIKQHRKPLRKSKTEIEEVALVLTSPATSTADNIYIPPITYHHHQMHKPQPQNNTVFPVSQHSLLSNSNLQLWNRNTQKNEEDFVFTTQHPLFTTTEVGATPKRHKVIDILKSLIPSSIPAQLTALLENGIEQEAFPESFNYNTPPAYYSNNKIESLSPYELPITMPSPKTSVIPPRPVTTNYPITYTTRQAFAPSRTSSIYNIVTPKWKPWYLGGSK
ncbi:unnamed protein product [Caenorhabditis bovis]|uniref:Uncharacterized protein n=1 Tax=Caenorhabditis bovis TaxID=2654633 RepID=A0A8S1EFX9_9PELO|nr:unnamed protein product [Caenorhabditis bovis]